LRIKNIMDSGYRTGPPPAEKDEEVDREADNENDDSEQIGLF